MCYRKAMEVRMGKLVCIAGPHSIAAIRVAAGRYAGRHAVAFRFFGRWQFITDEDSGDLLTWKTEEEALGNAEDWRRWWDTLKLPGARAF
jgi:hypothetical protein